MSRFPAADPAHNRPVWVRESTDWPDSVSIEAGRALVVAMMAVLDQVASRGQAAPEPFDLWFEAQPSADRRLISASQASTLRALSTLAGGWVAWPDVVEARNRLAGPGRAAGLVAIRPWVTWLDEVARG